MVFFVTLPGDLVTTPHFVLQSLTHESYRTISLCKREREMAQRRQIKGKQVRNGNLADHVFTCYRSSASLMI